jgi:hypothetical protein
MGSVLSIQATQHPRPLPIEIEYDRMIWSGLSWGVGEIRPADLTSGVPVAINVSSREKAPTRVVIEAYAVRY